MDEFWAFIQPKFPSYRERSVYINQEFSSILEMLESNSSVSGDESVTSTLFRFDFERVNEAWLKALERRTTDPEGAITMARTLLETVCKNILDEENVTYADAADLPLLYKLLANQLNLAPSLHSEDVIKRILGGCASIVEGLGALRNRQSDAHGVGKSAVRAATRHAALAVNLTGAMATFLFETWQVKESNENKATR